MDRRHFLKFMGVTAASTAAASTIIALPETEPKIELLEETKIVTKPDGLTIFHYVLDWKYDRNENINISHNIGNGDLYPMPGRIAGEVTVHVHLQDEVGALINNQSKRQSVLRNANINDMLRVGFQHPELNNKIFIMNGYREFPGTDGYLSARSYSHETALWK